MILLIGNYTHDRQESMQRFAEVMLRGLKDRGIAAHMISPHPALGNLRPAATGVGKWLGYVDKLLFISELRRTVNRFHLGEGFLVHICDHSNAPYAKWLQNTSHVVTCHDLLAVRSALGQIPENPTRWSGRFLQKMILAGLRCARHVVCVSEDTRRDLAEVSDLRPDQVSVVPNGLNYPYRPLPAALAGERLAALISRLHVDPAILARGYILHVGGNQWYKNRAGVLRIYEHLATASSDAPALVFAGKPLTPSLEAKIRESHLQRSVISLTHCTSEDLQTLYASAECLLFPSLAEGFGWPIIEAQACGCRVATSDRKPMQSIGGDAAVCFDPENVDAASATVFSLLREDPSARDLRIHRGVTNALLYSTERMIDGYIEVYEKLKSMGSPS